MADTILKAEHLTKTFISGKKTLTAVDDVSFELKQGECLGIVGESMFSNFKMLRQSFFISSFS